MANVFIEESILQDWADFVREKTGTSDKMKPTELLAKTKSEWASGGGSAKKYIVPETTFSLAQSESGLYGYTTENTYQFTEGKTYKVLWDGEVFEFVYTVYTVDVGQIVPIGHALGNASFFNTYSGGLTNFEDTGEPFMIGVASDNTFAILTDEEGESHVVAVYEEKAGGSSDDVRYVTFMSEDGKTELLVKPVAVGDDCADVISRGLIDTPTKSSTAQYDFTFSGWSISAGANADPDALKNVTEDRIVYAAYTSALRYYTISYYDGETLLQSESLAYGSMPGYVPTKTGYNFESWTPALSIVIGSASYTANWQSANLKMADYSWAEIVAMANAGEAGAFSIGDSKEFTLTNFKGKPGIHSAKLIGVNMDDKADGTGKANLTFMITPLTDHTGRSIAYTDGASDNNPRTSNVHYNFEDFANSNWMTSNSMATDETSNQRINYQEGGFFEDDLWVGIKAVNKKYYDLNTGAIETKAIKIWIESLSELGFNSGYDEGACYPVYTPGKSMTEASAEMIRMDSTDTTPAAWWTRSKFAPSYANGNVVASCYKIDETGLPTLEKPATSLWNHFCFCI